MNDDKPLPDELEDDGTLPTEQPTVDAASQTTLARQQRRQAITLEKVRGFWSMVLRDEIGAEVVWLLLRDLHTFEDERFGAAPGGVPDDRATDHARGQRDFGLRLYRTLVMHDREAVFAMHDKFDPAFTKPKSTARKRRSEPQ